MIEEAVPNEIENTAEMAVLGSCFCSDEAVYYAYRNLEEDYFLGRKTKMLFKVIKRMHKTALPIDPVVISEHFTAHEKKMIGDKFVFDLCEKVPTALNYRHYGDAIRSRFLTCQLDKLYDKLKADPFDRKSREEVATLWDRVEHQGSTVVSLKDATIKYTETLEHRKAGREFRYLSGYAGLDGLIGGFTPGNLIAVGARTSLGKTSLLLNFASKFLSKGIRVLFISAEMMSDEILDRLVSMGADIPISRLRQGALSPLDLTKAGDEFARLYESPMWFLEGGQMNMSRVRNAIDACNPSVVFVDFIQRFTPPNPAMNRAAYFSDLANEFKAVAMNKKLVVFAASQLNRDVEQDGGRAPQLSDFKESGGIEESADIAILLQVKKKEETPEYRKIVMHVCKHRNGPTGRVNFVFEKARTVFYEEEETLTLIDQRPPETVETKQVEWQDATENG